MKRILILTACIAGIVAGGWAVDIRGGGGSGSITPGSDASLGALTVSTITSSGTGEFKITSGGVNITTTTASMDFFGITIDSATKSYLGSLAVQSAKFGAYTPWTYTATKVSAWVDSGTVTGLQLYAYPSLPFSVASSTPILSSLVNVSTTNTSFSIANPAIPKGSYLIFTSTGTTGSPSKMMIPVWGIKQ